MASLRMAGSEAVKVVLRTVLQGTDKVYSSMELFGGRRTVFISHHGSLYRLTVTRQGKLILNK